MQIGDLEAGRRKKLVAFVPHFGTQGRDGGTKAVDRVVYLFGVGHVPLDTGDGQRAIERATSPVAHDIPHRARGGRLTHDAVVDARALVFKVFHDADGTVVGGTFFVRRDQ